ncbi:MAG TPA: hypothetical protein VGS22_07585 [Thermoanaerobaculia bacterium]|jgi:hypothetical protein|nr:hypothetical protein [Thermoanaerobaculia bacterium]
MRIVQGILAFVLIAGAAAAQTSESPGGPGPLPIPEPNCVLCVAPGATDACYATYGEECAPLEGFDHCSDEEAAAWCAGWPGTVTPPDPAPNCAICYAEDAPLCYANYGAECEPIEGLPHCTVEQANEHCSGWFNLIMNNPTGPGH